MSSISLKYRQNESNRSGTDYELILSMFSLKRAVENNNSFKLATERSCDQKFDDFYLEIGELPKVYYVQAKHKEGHTKVITHGHLTLNKDFSLPKYFNSYKKIKARDEKLNFWDHVRFLLCTTIECDYKGLSSKGIQVLEIHENDGIFITEEARLGRFFRLIISSKKAKKDVFKDAYSNMRRLSRKLAKHFVERAEININQMPILKSYYVALSKEVLSHCENGYVKFQKDFVEGNSRLSFVAKNFRSMFFQVAKDYIMEMKNVELSTTPGETNSYKKTMNEYSEILMKTVTVKDGGKLFWETMSLIELPLVGNFFELNVKNEQRLREFIEEFIQKLRKKTDDIVLVDQGSNFDRCMHELIGYVFMINEERIELNKEFLSRQVLPDSFLLLRNLLKVGLGEEEFKKLDELCLNFRSDGKIFTDKVHWDLSDDSCDDDATDEEIEDFLEKFLFVVTPKEKDFVRAIEDEMFKEFGMRDGRIIYDSLQSRMVEWSKYLDESGKGEYLTKDSNPYTQIINQQLRPVWHNVREPVASFTGREHDLSLIHSMLKSNEDKSILMIRNVLLSGMGGVGKSELARKYADIYKEHYQGNVLWIDAESTKIANSFRSLANRLYISTCNADGKDKDIEKIVLKVYKYFAKKKSLFIFDNADEYEGIKMFLPKLEIESLRPVVFITSRNRDLLNYEECAMVASWHLDVLPLEHAVNFFKNTLNYNENLKDEEIKELVTMFGSLPLAMQHAVIYINESEHEIRKYMKLFRFSKGEVKLLLKSDRLHSYDKTIFETFVLALEKLEQEEYGTLILDILKIIAFMSPDSIPKSMILPVAMDAIDDNSCRINQDLAEELLTRLLEILHRYSVIDLNEKSQSFKINRIIQLVIKLWICDLDAKNDSNQGRGENIILKKAMELVYNHEEGFKMAGHIASVWFHAWRYGDLIDKFYYTALKYDRTPLHFLCKDGNEKGVQSILNYLKVKAGDDAEKLAIFREKVVNACDNWKGRPIHWAAINNRLQCVKYLVLNGAESNVLTLSKETPLSMAAERGHAEVVDYLVNVAGASTGRISSQGTCPAYIATYYGHVDVIKILMQGQDDLERAKHLLHSKLNSKGGCSASYLEEILYTLDKEVVIKVVNEELYDRFPLSIAAEKGYTDTAECLIDKGAKIERSGYTPLHRASQEGHVSTVKLLVSRGSNPNDRNKDGRTALHFAAEWGRLDIVKYFIHDLQVDVDVVDSVGNTPLNIAARRGKLNVVKFLLRMPAKVSPINYQEYICDGRPIVNKNMINYLQELLNETVFGDKSYFSMQSRDVLALQDLTALNVASALGDFNNTKKLVEEELVDLQDVLISMKFSFIYDNVLTYNHLYRVYKRQKKLGYSQIKASCDMRHFVLILMSVFLLVLAVYFGFKLSNITNFINVCVDYVKFFYTFFITCCHIKSNILQ